MSEERVIRVFVSSTFIDMQAEREELAKHVFPQLRKKCEVRGVTWLDVDLRWGITEQEADRGEVLPICIADVRRCRPYFIGILGHRYGTTLDKIEQRLLEREGWLSAYHSRSYTEIEIDCGVLNDPNMADHAYFYFRDFAFSDEVQKQNALKQEQPQAAEKLADLKNRISKSRFPLLENYQSARQLGESVFADFDRLIDRLFPEQLVHEPLDREASRHEVFVASRTGFYVPCQEYFDQLDAHAQSGGRPLVLTGESGLGKSALLANWVARYRTRYPKDFVFSHFVGASPASTNWAALASRMIRELNCVCRLSISIPDSPDQLRLAFADALRVAGATHRVVIILDALNQLEDRDHAPDLIWLPRELPDNIRLIASTLPGRALAEIERRGWSTLRLDGLANDKRRQLIRYYLQRYGKTLESDLAEKIASTPLASNPLFLTALLEELRVWGEHELLASEVGKYLAASSVADLFEAILTRYERDYQRDRKDLVRDAMTFIWAARYGLSEAELRDLLGSPDGTPLPAAHWAPLFYAAERSLMGHGGLLNFFHEYLRQAIRTRYVPTEAQQHAAHLRLADYFAQREGPRKIQELAWQLAQSREWERLRDLLADLSFLDAATLTSAYDVFARWGELKLQRPDSPIEAYRPVVAAPESYPIHVLWAVANLLQLLGFAQESIPLLSSLSNRLGGAAAIQSADRRRIEVLVDTLVAQSLPDTGPKRAEKVLPLLEKAEAIAKAGRLDAARARVISLRAVFLHWIGRCNEALPLLDEAEKLLNPERETERFLLASVRVSKADIVKDDQPAVALHILREQEPVLRRSGHKQSLAICLQVIGWLLIHQQAFDEALRVLHECERLWTESGAMDKVGFVLTMQAKIHMTRQAWDKAMMVLRKEAETWRRVENPFSLINCLQYQALITYDVHHDVGGAIALLSEREQAARSVDDSAATADALFDVARMLARAGQSAIAFEKLRQAQRLWRELGNRERLKSGILIEALLREQNSQLAAAIRLHREAEQLCRELGDKEGEVMSIVHRARLSASPTGMSAETLPEVLRAQRLARDNGLLALAEQIESYAAELRGLRN